MEGVIKDHLVLLPSRYRYGWVSSSPWRTYRQQTWGTGFLPQGLATGSLAFVMKASDFKYCRVPWCFYYHKKLKSRGKLVESTTLFQVVRAAKIRLIHPLFWKGWSIININPLLEKCLVLHPLILDHRSIESQIASHRSSFQPNRGQSSGDDISYPGCSTSVSNSY